LSEVAAPRNGATAQSKDPYLPDITGFGADRCFSS